MTLQNPWLKMLPVFKILCYILVSLAAIRFNCYITVIQYTIKSWWIKLICVCCHFPFADEDSNCEVQIKVRRNTVYEAFLGNILRINCTVGFCNSSPPTVSWFKHEKTSVPVNVSSSSHIKTEWKALKHLEGVSYLVFQNIHSNDSGVYYCQSGLMVGHIINVSVHGECVFFSTLIHV